MKALKICSILTAFILASAAFSNGIAQTFGDIENREEDEIYTSPRLELIINLLRQEIKSNPIYSKVAEAINEQLDGASEYDSIGPDCYKYTPLLVNALDSKAKFLNFFYIQGNFKYSFDITKNNTNIIESFNFYEWYDDDNNFVGILPSVTIEENNYTKEIKDEEAGNYIVDNYCQPLNQMLDQHKNMPIPQLLEVLRQKFSK